MIQDIPNPIGAIKDKVGDVVGGGVDKLAGSAIDKLAEAVAKAVGESVKSVATIWTKVPTTGLGDGQTASKLQDDLFWYVLFAAVFSVLIAGGRMVWERRGEPLREVLRSLMTLVLVSAAGLGAIQLLVVWGDASAQWLIGGAGGQEFNNKMTAMLTVILTAGGPMGPILIIVLGLILVFSSLAQIFLMIARSGMLVLLTAVWPLSASATNTQWGNQWFNKITGWIIAFLLYKPVAALVYATGFQLFGDSKDLWGAVSAATMMVLSIAALPALMKLCVPAVASLSGGGGGGGGALAAGSMAASSVGGSPTGAVSQPSQSPASMGTPGSRGASGPSGAATSGGAASTATMPAGSGGGATSAGGGAAAAGGGSAAAGGGAASAGGAASGASAAAGPIGAGVAVAGQAMSTGKQAANDAVEGGGPDGSK
jgi:type IV secretion system protein TrbL